MLKNRNDVTVGREVNSSAMTQTVARKGHVKQKGVHTEKMIMSITPPLSTTGRFADVLRKGQRSQTWLWLVVYEINKNFLPEVVTLDARFTIMSLYHHCRLRCRCCCRRHCCSPAIATRNNTNCCLCLFFVCCAHTCCRRNAKRKQLNGSASHKR